MDARYSTRYRLEYLQYLAWNDNGVYVGICKAYDGSHVVCRPGTQNRMSRDTRQMGRRHSLSRGSI